MVLRFKVGMSVNLWRIPRRILLLLRETSLFLSPLLEDLFQRKLVDVGIKVLGGPNVGGHYV